MSKILTLDVHGHPKEWVSHQDAIIKHAKNQVAWQLGDGEDSVLFRGGENSITKKQSQIITAPIIAVKGTSASKYLTKPPTLTNPALFQRDRHLCAYCGRTFQPLKLTREHVMPTSRGGADVWTNVVTACESCNNRKDDRLPEECGMQLLYVPYAPNWAEALILENRNILFSQMEYLLSFIPSHSRIWEELKARAQ
jgi:5-methylcytosine-specific restriction endonuclease McrA